MRYKKLITKSKDEQKEDFKKMVELRGGKGCGRCLDLGYVGWDVEFEYYIPCSCLLEKEAEITKQRLAAMERSEN